MLFAILVLCLALAAIAWKSCKLPSVAALTSLIAVGCLVAGAQLVSEIEPASLVHVHGDISPNISGGRIQPVGSIGDIIKSATELLAKAKPMAEKADKVLDDVGPTVTIGRKMAEALEKQGYVDCEFRLKLPKGQQNAR